MSADSILLSPMELAVVNDLAHGALLLVGDRAETVMFAPGTRKPKASGNHLTRDELARLAKDVPAVSLVKEEEGAQVWFIPPKLREQVQVLVAAHVAEQYLADAAALRELQAASASRPSMRT